MTPVVFGRALAQRVMARVESVGTETGDTLIEVLITLIVLSLSGLALMTAFTATISGSAQQRSLAGNDTILRTVAEAAFSQIQQNQKPWYDPCATTSSYNTDFQNFLANQSANPLVPSGYSVLLTMQNMVLNTTTGVWGAQDASSKLANCQSLTMAPQLVTVLVTALNGTFDKTDFVVNGRNGISAASAVALTVTGLSPSSLGQGYLFQSVAISGTGINDAATISICQYGTGIGGTKCLLPDGVQLDSTQYNSSSSMTAIVSVNAVAQTGQVTVVVQNPDGSQAFSTLTITPSPTAISVKNTSTVTQGAQGETLDILGNGFQSGLTVTFSSSGITQVAGSIAVLSSTEFTVGVNVDPAATLGGGTIQVTTGAVVGAPSPNILTVVAPPTLATPTSATPCQIVAGTTTSCSITGTGFVQGDVVTLSNATSISSYAITGLTSTQITLSVSATATTGSSDLTVTPPDATWGATGVNPVTVAGGVVVTP